MNAQCAKCGIEIRIDESKLGERGARIRCPRCGNAVVVERRRVAPVDLDLDLSHAAPAKGQRRPLPATRGTAPAPDPDPELVSDADLVFADADLLSTPATSSGAGARAAGAAAPGARATVGRGPAVDPARVDTRVGPAPNLVRRRSPEEPRHAGPGLAPAHDVDAEADTAVGPAPHPPFVDEAETDDVLLAGALAADGTYTAPRSAKTSATVEAPVPRPEAGPAAGPEAGARRGRAPGEARATVAQEHSTPRSILALVGTILGSTLALAVLVFGILVFIGGGRIDDRVLRLDLRALAASWNTHPRVVLDHLQVTAMRSVLYPTRQGGLVLVVFGEVQNTGSELARRVLVTAELRDGDGRLVASESAPLGVPLGPQDLQSAATAGALAELYRARAPQAGATLAAGARVPYTVVLSAPPPQVDRLEHGIALAYDTVVEQPPAPAPLDHDSSSEAGKGKAKNKGKAKARARSREAPAGAIAP